MVEYSVPGATAKVHGEANEKKSDHSCTDDDRDDGPAGNQARPPVVLTKALYGTLHGTRVA